jgi:hypothetical protein
MDSARLRAGFFLSDTASTTMTGRIADGEARERLIIWIRRRMSEFGITFEALAESIQHDLDNPPIYRDAKGNDWNGLGDMPDWLRAAKNAGVDPAFFRIQSKPEPTLKHSSAQYVQADLFE